MNKNTFVFEQQGKLKYLRALNIDTKHGFSTRMGGVSTLPHLSELNLAFGRGECDGNVRENLKIFCKALQIDSNKLISAKQIHSDIVRYVTSEDIGLESYSCDGFVTDKTDVALCVKIADCVPILFCDKENSVIGAAHAGWRGAAAGIAYKTVTEMLNHGAEKKNICAAIGPSIHSCCYEVGEDFKEALFSVLGSKAEKYLKKSLTAQEKYMADIVSLNRDFILEAGIAPPNISESGQCSCCNPELYFSHRASKGVRGTMAAVISL